MLNFVLRIFLLIAGLVFAASLAVALLVLSVFWLLRLGWAKLSGRPITPWAASFGKHMDPRAGFERFRQAAGQRGQPSAADVAAARARGEAVDSPFANVDRAERPSRRAQDEEVTDVRARPVPPR